VLTTFAPARIVARNPQPGADEANPKPECFTGKDASPERLPKNSRRTTRAAYAR